MLRYGSTYNNEDGDNEKKCTLKGIILYFLCTVYASSFSNFMPIALESEFYNLVSNLNCLFLGKFASETNGNQCNRMGRIVTISHTLQCHLI